jgi:hypothetical protein
MNMKTRLNAVLIMCLFASLVISCKHGAKSDLAGGSDSINLGDIKPLVHNYDSTGVGLPIFYNMYLSVEMSSLFQTTGAVYKPELLNSAEKVSDYVTSSKKALNLGVYAVDLSYAKVFEQYETAAKYFNAMEKMAEELGIPSTYFENTARRFDQNINNKDSLIAIANEVYMATDKYLRENERYSAAAQIILGGWVEALDIAVDVANSTKSIDIIERFAEQKTSLENVITMLDDYSDDVAIKQNLQRLKELKPMFDALVINVDGKFDPASASGKKTIEMYLMKVNEVGRKIKEIRKEIVS